MPNIYKTEKYDDIVFGVNWFKKHQRKLLWLLNTPVIKLWFRWVMAIRTMDIPLSEKVTEILPSNFSYGDRLFTKGKKAFIERKTDFRTHDKYSKRLYFAFKPVWWAMHALDWVALDRVEALTKLSFGFSTLTVYPEADGGSTSGDCWVQREGVNETFSTIRAGAGTAKDQAYNIHDVLLGGSTTTNQFRLLRRTIETFDTSALTSGANISAAVYSVSGLGKYQAQGQPSIDLTASTPASNNTFATTDYGQLGGTSFANVAYATLVDTEAYNNWTLDANGIANISKTGVSKFGMRTNWDTSGTFSGTWASGQGLSGYSYWSADKTGTDKDPKLVITYTTSTNWTQTLSDTTTITASLKKTDTRTLSQTVTLTASMLRVIQRILTQTITLTASALKTPKKTLSEVVTLTATFLRTINHVLSQTITLTVSFIKQGTRLFTETVVVQDTLEAMKVIYEELLETLTIVDQAISRTIQKVYSEIVTLTASMLRTSQRVLSEALTLVDTFLGSVVRYVTFSEVTTLSDAIARLEQRILTETTTITATFAGAKAKLLSEVVTLTATFTRITGRLLTEILTITATIPRFITRAFSQVVTLTATSLQMGNKILSQTITLTATTIRQANHILRETIHLADQLIMRLNGIVTNLWSKVGRTIDSWTKEDRS